jgi:aspartate aminotransferase
MTIALLTRPGDEVVVQDPSFPVYESVIRFAGGRPVFVRLREENEFRLRIEDVEDVIKGLHRVRGLIINTPHNPTGSILGKEDIEEIIRFAKRRNMFIVSDEIYEDFVYEGKHYSFLQDPDWRDYIVYISGFSKTWSMTGLRIGYVIAREEIIKKLEVFATNVYSCPPAPFQLAAIKALELGTKWFERYLDEYRRRRDAAYEELSKVPGVRVIKGRGAFYLFPNVKEVARAVGARDVDELAKRVLFEAGIVFLPGTAFPLRGGEGYFRVSYALPVERIREGIKRFRDWVKDKVGL